MLRQLIIFLITLLTLPGHAQFLLPSVSNSLSNLHVNDLVQDHQGLIWIATAKGLCRYDGVIYTNFYHSESQPGSIGSDKVNALCFDGRALWCATGEGVSMLNLDTWQFANYRVDHRQGIFCLGFLSCGKRLLTYGYGGIYEVRGGSGRLVARVALEGKVVQQAIVDAHGRIWALLDDNSLMCFDASGRLHKRLSFGAAQEVYCIYQVPDHDIMLGTSSGVVAIDKDSYALSPGSVPPALASLPVKFVKGYAQGKVVIGTRDNHLRFFDFYKGAFTRFPNTDDTFYTGVMDLTCAYADRSGNLWLGTFNSGVKYLFQKRLFDTDKALVSSLKDKFVTRVVDDHKGHLWIGTRYSGLVRYDKQSHQVTEFSTRTNAVFQRFGNFIQSLYIDSSGRLWVCSENNLMVFDISGGGLQLRQSYTDVGSIVTIAEDARHRIWTGSSVKGITIYGADLQWQKTFLPCGGKINNITRIVPLSAHTMLFSAYGDNIYYIDVSTLRTRPLSPRLSSQFKNVINLRRISGNRIAIGTYGNGLMVYDPQRQRLRVYSYGNGLKSNDIVGMEQDRTGSLWVSSSYGLYRINLAAEKVRPYLMSDGTAGDQYHEKSECITDEGEIIFGGNHGVTQVVCGNSSNAAHNVPVLLADLKVFNKSVPITVDGGKGILTRHISRTREIELSHDQNVFSLDFIGLTYETPKNIEYAYKLENFDQDWNYTGEYNRASYSKLSAGTYVFKVKIRNGADEWEREHTLLTIKVLPSPWLTPWAIFLYIVLFVLALFGGIVLFVRLRLRKERAIMESNEIRREKRLAQMKVNFFTNISHELRTPLTMIYDPVKLLQKDEASVSTDSRPLLTLIEKNAERLLKLVNQILDYGRLENDTLKLSVLPNDCVGQIVDIVNVYKLYAAEKNIEVSLTCPYDRLVVVYDPDKMDKILNNLLFNALKYTPMGGHVNVSVALDEQAAPEGEALPASHYLVVKVVDDGHGVDETLLPGIFDRFRRLVNGGAASKTEGYGVGLNYVKHLVDNHHGSITAQNGTEKGMVFAVTIPVDETAYSPEEIGFKDADSLMRQPRPTAADAGEQVADEVDEAALDDSAEDTGKHILVVDDNSEMVVLLRSILQQRYSVEAAVDGVDALARIKESGPDLVISDVMMPRMDGFALCRTIKRDAELCHIPVILLTAKPLEEDKIKGYREGADLYLNKPFNPDLLLSMLDSVFRRASYSQHLLARTMGGNTTDEQEELDRLNDELSPLDKRFLDKLNSYVDEHISDSELNVNIMGRDLGFSRTNFYRKVKSLTGMSPNDFLRVYRLNRSVELIRQREYPLNEIGVMVGFGTQSYFSSCFKRHFGVPPKDYLRKPLPGPLQ